VDFNINAADGAKLAVTYYPPIVRPAPAALLLHMLGRGKGDWEAFAKNLQKQGWAVMAMDLRGHGASTGPVDWTKAPGDVQAVFNALAARPEVDDETPRLALVGSSIGSNLALLAGAADPTVKAVVALSPGLDYMGLKPGDSIDKFGDRPVLLVASEDDAYSADTVKQLAPKLLGGKSKLFTDAGHGNAMFSDPTLETTLMDWLNVNVRDLK
jgi:pimeloyl-ACP methyl ester carboxylesterase